MRVVMRCGEKINSMILFFSMLFACRNFELAFFELLINYFFFVLLP